MHFTVIWCTSMLYLQHTLTVPNPTARCPTHQARCDLQSVESFLQGGLISMHVWQMIFYLSGGLANEFMVCSPLKYLSFRCCYVHIIASQLSALYSISLKMPQNDAQLQFYCAHSLCVKPVSICSTVNEVSRAKLRASTNKHLGQLFLPGAHWPPGHTLQLVLSGAGGHMAVAVTIQLTSTKRVLMPDL